MSDPEVEVPERCAAACTESRRDVRMESMCADGGAPPGLETPPAVAFAIDSSANTGPDAHASGGCSTRAEGDARDDVAPMSTSSKIWLVLSLLLWVVRVRRANTRPAAFR